MSTNDPSSKSDPVLVWMSVLAALQVFFAGSAATTVMTESSPLLTAIFAFGALAVGAAQVGVQFYVRGQVTPNSDVSERVVGGAVVAGKANDLLPEGTKVRDVGQEPPVSTFGVQTFMADDPERVPQTDEDIGGYPV